MNGSEFAFPASVPGVNALLENREMPGLAIGMHLAQLKDRRLVLKQLMGCQSFVHWSRAEVWGRIFILNFAYISRKFTSEGISAPPPYGFFIGIYLFYENWSTETFGREGRKKWADGTWGLRVNLPSSRSSGRAEICFDARLPILPF